MAHGAHISKVVAPQSTSYQGPFGRICSDLEPWIPQCDDCTPLSEPALDKRFMDFAQEHMVEDIQGGVVTKPEDLLDAAKVAQLEADFGTGVEDKPKTTGIPAGYTYFGQFVDHDITFDPASSLVRQNDPNSLFNFRTPRLDLDNLYGRGPHDQPYMFEIDHSKGDGAKREKLGAWSFVLGATMEEVTNEDGETVQVATKFGDLPRAGNNRAIIGDMRNDENSIVSQLQLAFLKAHNALIDRAMEIGSCTPFDDARRTLRWLYQWIVWNDFVKRIANDEIFNTALHKDKAAPKGSVVWKLGLDHVYKWKHQPFMPVEFAVAAYRFGHSMVRNGYRTNVLRGAGQGDQAPLFDSTPGGANDLRGFRPMKKENVIQWDWFLPMDSSVNAPGFRFPQRARKIDTKLSNALATLAEQPNVLAYRNLKRGWSFGLPKGTDVARKYVCENVIALDDHEPDSLWYYILKEAAGPQGKHGEMLGRLGSTLICAVFAGLLKGDPQSWINQQPCWTPSQDPLLKKKVTVGEAEHPVNFDSANGEWELSAIIRLAGVPVSGGDIEQTDQAT